MKKITNKLVHPSHRISNPKSDSKWLKNIEVWENDSLLPLFIWDVKDANSNKWT